ncbi:MAG: aspartate carbamoyltransferase, partial [Planctomycetota bacterium]
MADTAAPRQLDGHLLSLAGLSADTLRSLLTDAREFADATEPPPSLAGRTVALLFLEDSTRTRSSFRLAAERLGARAVDLTGVGSSVSKGESLIDTARTIEAMGID